MSSFHKEAGKAQYIDVFRKWIAEAYIKQTIFQSKTNTIEMYEFNPEWEEWIPKEDEKIRLHMEDEIINEIINSLSSDSDGDE